MNSQSDLGAIARAIIDDNLYMVLATADQDGRPWASPVFYAAEGYAAFYWMSSPDVTHSQNIATRPGVSIVIFDSRVPAGTGQAVYMAATAEELAGADLDLGVEVYPGPAERGARTVTPDELRPPGPYRLYRATVSQHWILCPRTAGPCVHHGMPFDHRTAVTL
jgi:Pyridoxamine 5'-phosphate oxidase